jgi:hypothetical protein
MPKGSEKGLGMARSNRVAITNPPAAAHQMTSGADGEQVGGVGSTYRAEINERPNKSNNRNMGPTGPMSFAGRTPLPVATKARRHTGRVG